MGNLTFQDYLKKKREEQERETGRQATAGKISFSDYLSRPQSDATSYNSYGSESWKYRDPITEMSRQAAMVAALEEEERKAKQEAEARHNTTTTNHRRDNRDSQSPNGYVSVADLNRSQRNDAGKSTATPGSAGGGGRGTNPKSGWDYVGQKQKEVGEALSNSPVGIVQRSLAGGAASGVRDIGNALGYVGQMMGQSAIMQADPYLRMSGQNDIADRNAAEVERMRNERYKPLGQILEGAGVSGAAQVDKGIRDFANAAATDAKNGGKVLNVIAQTANGVGGMVPNILSNVVAPGSGMWVLAAKAFGNATESALDAGASNENAVLYGGAVSAVEVLTEMMFDGIPGLRANGERVLSVSSGLEKAVGKYIKNAAAQNAVMAAFNILGEGAEEFVAEFGDWGLNKLLVGNDNRTLSEVHKDAWYSAFVGSLISFVMSTPSNILNIMSPQEIADGVMRTEEAQRTYKPDYFNGMTEEEAKAEYRRLSNEFHPDTHPDDATAAKYMAEINDAYNNYKNANKKDSAFTMEDETTQANPDQRSAVRNALSQYAPVEQTQGGAMVTQSGGNQNAGQNIYLQALNMAEGRPDVPQYTPTVQANVPVQKGGINLPARNANIAPTKQSIEATAVNDAAAGHTTAEMQVIDEYKNAVDPKLLSWAIRVRQAYSSGDVSAKKMKLVLNPVTDRAASEIRRITGIDATGYTNMIDGSAVVHIENRHGEHGEHDSTMREPEDLARVQYVLDNFDSADTAYDKNGNPRFSTQFFDKNNNRAPMVCFAKKVNGTYYVVEAVPDSADKKLHIVSAYMDNNSGSITQALNMNGKPSLQPTPEAPHGPIASATPTVAQNQPTVNRAVAQTGEAEYNNSINPKEEITYGGEQSAEPGDVRPGGTGRGLRSGRGNGENVEGRVQREAGQGNRKTAGAQSIARANSKDKGASGLTFGDEVDASHFHIKNADPNHKVRIVTGGDTEYTKIAKAVAGDHKLTLVVGDTFSAGKSTGIEAFYNPATDEIVVPVDDPKFTAPHYVGHEKCHALIRAGKINVDKALDAAAANLPAGYVDYAVQDIYSVLYPNNSESRNKTELVCDAAGNMNRARAYGYKDGILVTTLDEILTAIHEQLDDVTDGAFDLVPDFEDTSLPDVSAYETNGGKSAPEDISADFAEAEYSVAPPYRPNTPALKAFIEGLDAKARATFDLFNDVNNIGNDISKRYMLPSKWNEQVRNNADFAETAKAIADRVPDNIRKNAHINKDGTITETPFEKEFRMERSMMQRLVDALPMETISSTVESGGKQIRISNKDKVNTVGGEEYRRALVEERRQMYKEGRLPTKSIGGLSKDTWGAMGFLATNGKTGASGDFTTLCPQMYYNNGCFYCYRRAALTTGVNNKLVGENVWYTGEVLQLKQEDIDNLNKNGGLRIQSFGDWMEQHSSQLADLLMDAEKVGLQIKIITKEPSMIETVALFRDQGIGKNLYFNLSADYTIEAQGKINNQSGEGTQPRNPLRPYMKQEDGRTFWKRALTVEEANEYRKKYPWVNTRIVATTVDEFLEGLRSPMVDVVTGYHGNIRQFERVSSATGETLLQVEPLGDAGMPRFAFDGKKWTLEFEGKTATHKKLAKAIEDAGLQMQYYIKSCCITGRCATCEGKCGKLARDFNVKNATNADKQSIAYWRKHMESAEDNPLLLSQMEDDEAKALLDAEMDRGDVEYSTAPDEQAEERLQDLAQSQLKNYEYNQNQTEVGSTLRTLGKPGKSGSPIKRSSKYGVGKEIGGTVYFHRDYVDDVIPGDVYETALQTLQENYPDFQFNCVEYNPKTETVRFDEAPGFDSEREPAVGDYVAVNADGTTRQGHTDYIWHHKWLWVKDDYKGFDVKKSWDWSKQWLSTISGKTYEVNGKPYNDNAVSDGNGIDRWNAQLKAYDLPLDKKAAPVKQAHTSRGTSINTTKIPVLYTMAAKKGAFKPGTVNIDIGAGVEGTPATAYLKDMDVTSMPFDPFNRNRETNKAVTDFLQSGKKADTATCSNCLNVIDNADARANVILEMAKAIKPDGTAYFTVYSNKDSLEAGKAGEVQKKPDQWQELRDAKTYVPEIKRYFNDVPDPKSGLIIARDPKENLPKAVWQISSTAYIDKEGNAPYTEDEVVEFSTAPDEDAVERLKEMDKKYLSAVESGDMETAQKMVDDAAKTAGYTIKKYHQTSVPNIHIFNIGIGTHGGTDSEVPYGIFTKNSRADIGLGDYQMRLYLKAGNTFVVKDRNELRSLMPQAYNAFVTQLDNVDAKYDKMAQKAEDDLFDAQDAYEAKHPDVEISIEDIINNRTYDDPACQAANEKWQAVMDEWREASDKIRVQAKDILTEYLKSNGYDSMELKFDKGSNGRSTDTFIVFSPDQAKLGDPVTYDDDGNVIPLSERFNPENQDIRYSSESEIDRLETENERLRQRLAEARAETKLTRGWRANPNDVAAAAKTITESASSTYSQTMLQTRLTKLVEEASNGEISEDEVMATAGSIARDVVEKSSVLASKDLTSYNAARDYLKRVYIEVPETLRTHFDDFGSFAKAHKEMRMKTEGVPIADVYSELQRDLGKEYFPDMSRAQDMLQQIGDVMNSLAPVYGNQYSFAMQMVIEEMSNEVLAAAMDIGQKVTFADKADAKRREEVKFYKGKLKTAETYIRSLQRIATRRAEQNEALKQHYADSMMRKREARDLRQSQDKLLRVLKRLNNKKLPMATKSEILDAQKAVAGVVDTVQKYFTGELKQKRWTEQGITDIGQLEELVRKKTDASLGDPMYDPNFILDKATVRVLDRYKMSSVKDMTALQIQELTQALLNIEARIAAEKKFVNSQLAMEFYQAGEEVIGDVSSAKPGKIQRKLRPLSAFLRMADYNDNSPLVVAYKEMLRGEEEADLYRREALKPFSSLLSNHKFLEESSGKHAKAIKITGTDIDGNDVTAEITPMMRVALYLHSLNDDNFRHIYKGGIVIPDMDLYRSGKISEAYNKGKTIRLTRPTLQRLAEQMTQNEREFAKLLHSYYNEYAPSKMNPVSLALDGYEKYTMPDYYHITVDKNFLNADYEAKLYAADSSLARPGWGEERIESVKPIVLRDANTEFLQALTENSMYACQAIPLHNMNRLLNVQLVENRDSVKAALNRQFPDGSADSYISKFMADYAGHRAGRKNPTDKALEKLRSNYSQGVLFLALSTAGVQAASYPTAAAVVSPAALLQALTPSKIDVSFIDKRTAVFTKRTDGFSMLELAELREQGKHIPKVLNWIQGVDVATTSLLKRAAYYEIRNTKKNLQPGTEEFEKAVTDTYTRIIEETQPNYSAALRPEVLRSDSAMEKAMIIFATQPLQQYGIIYDALGRYESAARHYKTNKNEETKKAKGQAAKGVARGAGVLLASSIMYALLRLGVDAALGNYEKKYKPKEKSDDTELEAFLRQFGMNMLGSFTGMWPIAKTAVEFVEATVDTISTNFGGKEIFGKKWYGYDVSTISAINDAMDSLATAINYVTRAITGKSAAKTAAKKVVAAVEDIAVLLGIPASRIHSYIKAIAHWCGVEEDDLYDMILD